MAKLAEARAQARATAVGPLAMEVARSGRSDGSGQEVEAVAAEALSLAVVLEVEILVYQKRNINELHS